MVKKFNFIIIKADYRKILFILAAALSLLAVFNIVIYANMGAQQPLSGANILIDPGHGGIDGGTHDGKGFLEKNINLSISLKLKEEMIKKGADVKLTRETDVSLDDLNNSSESRHRRDLTARLEMINSGEHDIFISIHANCIKGKITATGPIVLYSPLIPESKTLARILHDKLYEATKNVLKGERASPIPVKADFFILKNAKIPGVIVETGFISNPTEKKLLSDPDYQVRLVNAIIDGLCKYMKK